MSHFIRNLAAKLSPKRHPQFERRETGKRPELNNTYYLMPFHLYLGFFHR